MDLAQQMDHLRADAETFAAVLETAPDLGVMVPTCPEWCLSDLGWHIVEVHDFWAWVVQHQTMDPSGYPEPERVVDDELVTSVRAGAKHLADVLAGADPATPVWTWSAQRDVGFIQRFQVQEMALHRYDAEGAVGPPSALAADVAVDGLTVFAQFLVPAGTEQSIVALPSGAKPVVVGSGEPAAVLEGSPSDLLLALWRRVPLDPFVVDGTAAAGSAFLDGLALS
jgi:uncharacterized protein (TIGR03083 family)